MTSLSACATLAAASPPSMIAQRVIVARLPSSEPDYDVLEWGSERLSLVPPPRQARFRRRGRVGRRGAGCPERTATARRGCAAECRRSGGEREDGAAVAAPGGRSARGPRRPPRAHPRVRVHAAAGGPHAVGARPAPARPRVDGRRHRARPGHPRDGRRRRVPRRRGRRRRRPGRPRRVRALPGAVLDGLEGRPGAHDPQGSAWPDHRCLDGGLRGRRDRRRPGAAGDRAGRPSRRPRRLPRRRRPHVVRRGGAVRRDRGTRTGRAEGQRGNVLVAGRPGPARRGRAVPPLRHRPCPPAGLRPHPTVPRDALGPQRHRTPQRARRVRDRAGSRLRPRGPGVRAAGGPVEQVGTDGGRGRGVAGGPRRRRPRLAP